jgi:hypothetical protein
MSASRERRRVAALLAVAVVVCIALTACGGSSTTSTGKAVGGQPANGPSSSVRAGHSKTATVRQALTKFAACLRQAGVDIPLSQNSRGSTALNIKGINTSSARFKTAWVKCRGAVDVGRAFHKLGANARSAT